MSHSLHVSIIYRVTVISSYHIYASCFSAILWGKLCEIDIFLNQLIEFYSNNATILHHSTTHIRRCCFTKWRSYCDHRYVTSLHACINRRRCCDAERLLWTSSFTDRLSSLH